MSTAYKTGTFKVTVWGPTSARNNTSQDCLVYCWNKGMKKPENYRWCMLSTCLQLLRQRCKIYWLNFVTKILQEEHSALGVSIAYDEIIRDRQNMFISFRSAAHRELTSVCVNH